MNFPYSGEAYEAYEKLFPFSQFFCNRIYKNPNGNYVYVNKKGYLHMLKPCRIRENGETVGYQINDYMLTKDNRPLLKKTFGWFKTEAECIERILSFHG